MGKLFSANELKNLIPYQSNMLMVDKVYVENENRVIAQKCITANDPVFLGHFPAKPILPGVLQVEAIVQTAEVLLRPILDPAFQGDFYLKSIQKVKFRRPNEPGDRMIVELDVTAIHEDSADFTATLKNGGGVACSAQGTVAVRKKEADIAPICPLGEFDKGVRCEMDNPSIQQLIPHRYPFLLVDYVSKCDGNHVTAIKNLSGHEPIFRCYNDSYTVLGSIIQAEISAQAGAIYMLSREENRGKIALYMGIKKSEFFRPVYPGCQLRLEVDMPDTKSRAGKGYGAVYVNDELASETTMLFIIASN